VNGRNEKALTEIERALIVAHQLGKPLDEGLGLRIKGEALHYTRQITEALSVLEKCKA
jgi:hypothetical protein